MTSILAISYLKEAETGSGSRPTRPGLPIICLPSSFFRGREENKEGAETWGTGKKDSKEPSLFLSLRATRVLGRGAGGPYSKRQFLHSTGIISNLFLSF